MVLYTLLFFIIIFVGFRYLKTLQAPGLSNWFSPIAYTLKVAFGFYFIYIYSEVYGTGSLSADAGAFMQESKILNSVFYQSPIDYIKLLTGIGDQKELVSNYLTETHHWDAGEQAIISDNRNILRVQSVIHFFSKGYASIHVLVMCFISTIGLLQLYIGIKDRTVLSNKLTFLFLLLIPSVIFWTSGILKEPLMFLGLGLFVRGVFGNDYRIKKIGFVSLGSLLLIAFKPYILFSAIPAILFYFTWRKLPKYKFIGAISALILSVSLPMVIFQSTTQKVVELISRKQFDFKNVAKGGLHVLGDTSFYFFRPDQMDELIYKEDSIQLVKPMNVLKLRHGAISDPVPVKLEASEKNYLIYFKNDQSDGYIEITLINNSLKQMFYNIPESLINVLLRPYLNDPGSWLKYPAVLELTIIYIFLIYAFIKRRVLSADEKGLVYSILIFIFFLALTIGWVTPVLGAIVRYRIPILIGLVVIGLILLKSKSTKSKIL